MASFSGGAVGVISALMVVEINNVKQQEKKRCKYCLGTGMHFGISLISKEPSFRLLLCLLMPCFRMVFVYAFLSICKAFYLNACSPVLLYRVQNPCG